MNKQQEALKLALEALTDRGQKHPDDYKELKNDAIAAIHEALADSALNRMAENASKPWVGLSTIELDEVDAPIRERGHATIAEIYRAIEPKLREKNA